MLFSFFGFLNHFPICILKYVWIWPNELQFLFYPPKSISAITFCQELHLDFPWRGGGADNYRFSYVDEINLTVLTNAIFRPGVLLRSGTLLGLLFTGMSR